MTVLRIMWIIASTSYKNCFQYVCVLLTEFINTDELSLATNLSTFPFKLFSAVPAVSVLGLILCIAKFIDEHKWCRLRFSSL